MEDSEIALKNKIEELSCTICSIEYDLEEHRPSACQNCGNSICQSCINDIDDKAIENGHPFKCPNCQHRGRQRDNASKIFIENKNLKALLGDEDKLVKHKPICSEHPTMHVSYLCLSDNCHMKLKTFCSKCLKNHRNCKQEDIHLISDFQSLLHEYSFPISVSIWKKEQMNTITKELDKLEDEMKQMVSIVADFLSHKEKMFTNFNLFYFDDFKNLFTINPLSDGKYKVHGKLDQYIKELSDDIDIMFRPEHLWKEIRTTVNQKVVFWTRKLFSDPQAPAVRVKDNLKTLNRIKRICPFVQKQYFLAGIENLTFRDTNEYIDTINKMFLNGGNWENKGSFWDWDKYSKDDKLNNSKSSDNNLESKGEQICKMAHEVIREFGADIQQIQMMLSDKLTKSFPEENSEYKAIVLPNVYDEDKEKVEASIGLKVGEIHLRVLKLSKSE